MPCRLTDYGRRSVNDLADTVRRGGTIMHLTPKHRDAGFGSVGEGDSRIVLEESDDAPQPIFQGGDCVVKVSKFTDPWQNHNEIVNWEYANDAAKEVLAPVTEYADDTLWLVMPKAEGLDVQTRTGPIHDRLEAAGYELADVRPDHIGLINGVPKVVDHGHRLDRLDGTRVGPTQSESPYYTGHGFYDRKERNEL